MITAEDFDSSSDSNVDTSIPKRSLITRRGFQMTLLVITILLLSSAIALKSRIDSTSSGEIVTTLPDALRSTAEALLVNPELIPSWVDHIRYTNGQICYEANDTGAFFKFRPPNPRLYLNGSRLPADVATTGFNPDMITSDLSLLTCYAVNLPAGLHLAKLDYYKTDFAQFILQKGDSYYQWAFVVD